MKENMKLNIREMAAGLFAQTPIVLDLDSGRLYSPVLQHHRRVVEGLANVRVLPRFSTAPVYQAYLGRVMRELKLVPWDGCGDAPEFALIPDFRSDEQDAFIEKADHFCAGFDYALCNERARTTPKYDPAFPVFLEFKRAYALQFAKQWCGQEGYAWYEEA